jgi:hypothetical protein
MSRGGGGASLSIWLHRRFDQLKVDRHGDRVPFIRNYPLQYVIGGSVCVALGMLILPFTRGGLGLTLFGAVSFIVAWYYWQI